MALKRKPSNPATEKPSCRACYTSPGHEEDEEATEPDLSDTEDDEPIEPEAAYEETKALGDADREVSTRATPPTFLFDTFQTLKAMHAKPSGHRTADILTIFKKVTDYIHPDKGKIDGHFCLVCRYVLFLKFHAICNITNILPREKRVRETAQFFSGATSTLRTHIARYELFLSSNAMTSLIPAKKREPLQLVSVPSRVD
jgi:hypothetical protein